MVFFFPIFWCSWSGDHPQDGLARFGYRLVMKVEKKSESFYILWLPNRTMYRNLTKFLKFWLNYGYLKFLKNTLFQHFLIFYFVIWLCTAGQKKKGEALMSLGERPQKFVFVRGQKAAKFVFSLDKRPQMWPQSYRQPLAPTIKLLAVTAAGRVQENSGLIFTPVIGSKPVAFQASSLPAPSLFLLRAPRRSGFFLLSASLLQGHRTFGRDFLVLLAGKSSCIVYYHKQFQFRFYFKKIGPVDVLKGGLESSVFFSCSFRLC